MSFRGSTLNNIGGFALTAEDATVNGNLFLFRGFVAYGTIDLAGAKIGGHLNCQGGIFDRVLMKETVVKSTFVWSQLDKADVAELDLRGAVVGSLADDEKSWPKPGRLRLDGFEYGKITGTPLEDPFEEEVSEADLNDSKTHIVDVRVDSPTDAQTRLRWVALDTAVRPQPYRQLAKVLGDMGDDEGAKQVLSEMESRIRKQQRKDLPVVERPLVFIEDKLVAGTIGYGLYPLRALYCTAGLWFLGWVIHRRAQMIGSMAPIDKDAYETFHRIGTIPPEYPPFSAPVYSLENSVPFLKLGQDAVWAADLNPKRRISVPVIRPRWFGWIVVAWCRLLDTVAGSPTWLRRLRWAMIIVGWLLATFFVAGLSGIIKAH